MYFENKVLTKRHFCFCHSSVIGNGIVSVQLWWKTVADNK